MSDQNRKLYKTKKIKFINFDCNHKNLTKKYKSLIKKIGSPSIFINCSYPVSKNWGTNDFDKINQNELDKNIKLQLSDTSWLAKLTADDMKKTKKGGSIILMGSIYGHVAQDLNIYAGIKNMRENMPYTIIKSGISGLTKQMASYYGKYNIRINTVSPGGLVGHIKGKKQKQDSKFLKQYSLKVPLKRLGKANEVAAACVFLSSDAASYITGIDLLVDGGWTAV